MTRSRVWTIITALALSLVLVASACSGGTENSTPDSPDSGAVGNTPADTSTQSTESIATATVTIGDETYDFKEEGFMASNCTPDRLGAFLALLSLVGENGESVERSELDLILLHEGTDDYNNSTTGISVRLGHLDETSSLNYTPGWVANAQYAEQSGLPPGTHQVDSFVIDGNTATGTATFIDSESDSAFFRGEIDSVESVQGTFKVVCGSG